MIVTGIHALGKKRYEIELDGESAFALYSGELRAYQIRENEELSRETYESILTEVLLKRAKARSLHLLQEMDKTEYQMRQKLREGKYPERIVEDVIAWLYGYHYLDDRRYAESYISQKKNSRSRLQLQQDLARRGISKEIIREALEEDAPDEEELIRRWIEKKGIDPHTADLKERQKLFAFLARKGFRPGEINKALRD